MLFCVQIQIRAPRSVGGPVFRIAGANTDVNSVADFDTNTKAANRREFQDETALDQLGLGKARGKSKGWKDPAGGGSISLQFRSLLIPCPGSFQILDSIHPELKRGAQSKDGDFAGFVSEWKPEWIRLEAMSKWRKENLVLLLVVAVVVLLKRCARQLLEAGWRCGRSELQEGEGQTDRQTASQPGL